MTALNNMQVEINAQIVNAKAANARLEMLQDPFVAELYRTNPDASISLYPSALNTWAGSDYINISIDMDVNADDDFNITDIANEANERGMYYRYSCTLPSPEGYEVCLSVFVMQRYSKEQKDLLRAIGKLQMREEEALVCGM